MSLSTTAISDKIPRPFSPRLLVDLTHRLPASWDPFPETTPQARLAQLAKDHLTYLQERAYRLTRNQADAADLVQDTFERALKFVGPRVSPQRARNWLLVVMHNLFVDRYRANRSTHFVHCQELLMQLPAPEPEAPDPRDCVTIDDVHKALTGVPPVLRRVFELREIEGQSYAEIAATLNIPLVTVGTRLLRARRHIRASLAAVAPMAAAA
ncbi:MAG: RNA polymerase sigma factor [Deltaproteobacteria bacterium]|nr:RNA polymerase sigma factor [Deltaproteobacteria bacterium]